jgi:hypothetical protein
MEVCGVSGTVHSGLQISAGAFSQNDIRGLSLNIKPSKGTLSYLFWGKEGHHLSRPSKLDISIMALISESDLWGFTVSQSKDC